MGSGAGQNYQTQSNQAYYPPLEGLLRGTLGGPGGYGGLGAAGPGGALSNPVVQQQSLGGIGTQYSGPNWWVGGGGGGQTQPSQPLWQNPFSPMTPADWDALKEQYYPTPTPPGSLPPAASVGGSGWGGGEGGADFNSESPTDTFYGPSKNPALVGWVQNALRDEFPTFPNLFDITHAAPGAYDRPDYQLGSIYGAVSGVEAADVASPDTDFGTAVAPGPGFGEAGTFDSTMGQDTGWGVVGNTGGEGGHDIMGSVALGSPGDMTRGLGRRAYMALSSAQQAAVTHGALGGSAGGYSDFDAGSGGGFGFGVGGEGFGDNEGFGGGEGGAQGW